MVDRIKTILLLLLVANSLVLSGLLIFYSPNSTNNSLSEYLPRIRFGDNMSNEEFFKPSQIVIHFGENKHSQLLNNDSTFKYIFEDMKHWSFYDFSTFKEEFNWENILENEQGIEIFFSDPLKYNLLTNIFSILTPDFNADKINRLWLVKSDETILAYFISDIEDKIYSAQTSISPQRFLQYIARTEGQPLFDYHYSYPLEENKLVKQFYYLPLESFPIRKIKKSFTLVPIDDFIQLLFIDPSIVKKVEVDNSINSLYTDGNRSLQHYTLDRYITYNQPVFLENKSSADIEKDIYATIRFVNQQGGWEGFYLIDKISSTQNGNQSQVKFKQYVDGLQVYDMSDIIGTIQVQITNGTISSLQRSMILLDKNIEIETVNATTVDKLFVLLEENEIKAEMVKRIDLIYSVTQNKESINLEPTWKVNTIDNKILLFPAYERVVE